MVTYNLLALRKPLDVAGRHFLLHLEVLCNPSPYKLGLLCFIPLFLSCCNVLSLEFSLPSVPLVYLGCDK